MQYIFSIIFFSLFILSSYSSLPEASIGNVSAKENNESQKSVLYVDVREDSEWTAGHVDGALHVKLGDIEAGDFENIPKDTPIALYCRSGRRSGIAYDILKKAGYTNITNAGGMRTIKNVTITQ